jgi:hypothetical protein
VSSAKTYDLAFIGSGTAAQVVSFRVRAAVSGEIAVIPDSTITCPACGAAKTETMPTDACQYFYECTGCGELLRPKLGDCCVFCSYGSVPCPPIQAGETPTCRPS